MNNSLYQDLELENVIACPVCFELPTENIFVCRTGHHVCDRCRKRLTNCPSCQAVLTSTRNYLGEALINKILILKDSTNENNNGSAPSADVLPTSRPMRPLPSPPGQYTCMLEGCRSSNRMGVTDMIPHMEKSHAHLFEKFKNNSSCFEHNFNDFCFMKGVKKYHRGFHVTNMGVFFINLDVFHDKHMNAWISCAAPNRRCNFFTCKIDFINNETNSKKSFQSLVASTEQEKEWLLERGKVFVLDPASHELAEGQGFSLVITLVYKTTNPEPIVL